MCVVEIVFKKIQLAKGNNYEINIDCLVNVYYNYIYKKYNIVYWLYLKLCDLS